MKAIVKKILIGLLVVLVAIQFIRIDKDNPPVEESQEFMTLTNPPAEIATLMKTACYDCHSHETKYPWYTNVSPVSWWVKDHIDEGREHLNFSVWGTYSAKKAAHKLEECYEEVEEGHMPLPSYLWVHSEAKLSEEQVNLLVSWFKEKEQEITPEE
jgi:hypothetical protein